MAEIINIFSRRKVLKALPGMSEGRPGRPAGADLVQTVSAGRVGLKDRALRRDLVSRDGAELQTSHYEHARAINGDSEFSPYSVLNPTADLIGSELPDDEDLPGIEALDEQIRAADEKLVKIYRKDPMKFLKHELGRNVDIWQNDCPPAHWSPKQGYPLWSAQREIFQALVKYRRVAVRSGHAVSKTFTAADVVLYLAYAWRATGVTTAPTFRQVRDILWAEIRKHWYDAESWRRGKGKESQGGRLLQTSLELDDKWFVTGFSTDNPQHNIPGYHEETTFVVIDEACGVNNEVFDILETVLTSDNTFVLLIGNPVDPASYFRKCFRPKSDYYPIHISCYDSPNVKNSRLIYPQLCAPDWPDRMKAKWGEASPLFQARVLGEFPDTSTGKLIPLKYIIQALERNLPEGDVLSLGVDVARKGEDRSCLMRWESKGRLRVEEVYTKERTTKTIERAEWLCDKYTVTKTDKEGEEFVIKPVINVDDIGVGGGVTDVLMEDGYPVNGICVSDAADDTADEQGRIRFGNKRAQFYWLLRELFIKGDIDIDDEDLADELSQIPVKYKGGKIYVAEKEEIKRVLGRSPDLADTAMLAVCETTATDEADLVRWI